jgi:hypothetical protein
LDMEVEQDNKMIKTFTLTTTYTRCSLRIKTTPRSSFDPSVFQSLLEPVFA